MSDKFETEQDLIAGLGKIENVAHGKAGRADLERALHRLDDIEARAAELGVNLGVRPSSARDWLQSRLDRGDP